MSKYLLIACTVVAALAVNHAHAQSAPESQPAGPPMMWRGSGMMMWGGDPAGGSPFGPGMTGLGMERGCPFWIGTTDDDDRRSASAWLDGQLAYLHSELGVTSAQEPAWQAYAAAVRDRTESFRSSHRRSMSALWQEHLPFDRAYDMRIEMMQSHLDALKTMRAPALDLYRELTPEQQQRAARVLPQSMCLM